MIHGDTKGALPLLRRALADAQQPRVTLLSKDARVGSSIGGPSCFVPQDAVYFLQKEEARASRVRVEEIMSQLPTFFGSAAAPRGEAVGAPTEAFGLGGELASSPTKGQGLQHDAQGMYRPMPEGQSGRVRAQPLAGQENPHPSAAALSDGRRSGSSIGKSAEG